MPVEFKNCTHSIVSVSCGDKHTCFLASNGSIYATGANTEGQLGIGNYRNVNTPHKVEKDDRLNTIKFKKVECGSFTAGVALDDSLYVWGFINNRRRHRPSLYHQVPSIQDSSSKKPRIKRLCIRSNISVALDEKGTLHSWNSTQIKTSMSISTSQRPSTSSNSLLTSSDHPVPITPLKPYLFTDFGLGKNFIIGIKRKGGQAFQTSSIKVIQQQCHQHRSPQPNPILLTQSISGPALTG